MPRPPLSILPTLSLACSLLLCGLWAWTHHTSCELDYTRPNATAHALILDTGSLITARGPSRPGTAGWHWYSGPPMGLDWGSTPGGRQLLGFGTYDSNRTGVRMVWLPLWFPALLTAIPPVLWWLRRRKQRTRGFPVEVSPETSPPDKELIPRP